MKYLGDGIKNLPKKLEYFALDLNSNYLGGNLSQINYIGEGLK